jgi:RimJ/RimL family protein N-acetyltransferase
MYSTQTIIEDGRTLLIREAEGSDAGAVLEYVHLVCGETDFLTFGPGEFNLTLQQETDYLEKCRNTENSLYLLALYQGVIVGSLNFNAGSRPRVRHAGEFGVAVLQAYWGLGVASALLDALIAWARNGNIITKINLRVRADNQRAIALYERKGFVVEGTIKKAIFIAGVYYDHVCMGLLRVR